MNWQAQLEALNADLDRLEANNRRREKMLEALEAVVTGKAPAESLSIYAQGDSQP